MPICKAAVSPPMAAAPMPMGMAFEGSELMTGDTIGPYGGKTFCPIGTDKSAIAIAGAAIIKMRKKSKCNALLNFININSGGDQFRHIGPALKISHVPPFFYDYAVCLDLKPSLPAFRGGLLNSILIFTRVLS